LYRRFLAGQSRFPAAPPGRSTHELGLAFDLWINDESQLSDLGQVWEQMGGTWGGHFRDPIHFEAGGATEYAESQPITPDVFKQSPLEEVADVALSFIPGVTGPEIAGLIAPKVEETGPLSQVYNEVILGLEHPSRAAEDILLAAKAFWGLL